MAVRTRDELLESIRNIVPDVTSDAAITLIEDVTDTLADREVDWQARYEANDKEWRERYASRFFEEKKDEDVPPDEDEGIEKTIDELFEERK